MDIRTRRRALKLSMATVAERAHCTQGFLSMLERGKRNPATISYQLAVAIAKALDVHPEQLFGRAATQPRQRKVVA